MRIAIVTGASYGLGASIYTKLIKLGYKVYGISRTKPQLEDANFIWLKADLLNDNELQTLINRVTEPQIDLLVNNAGICFLKKTLDYTDDDFDMMFNLNFKVHVKLTKLLFDKVTNGLIINISSLADRYPDPTWGLYSSSKATLNIFFETLAEENKQVKIINILPSYVDTPMQHQIHDNTDFDWSQCMVPEDIAEAIATVLEKSSEIETGSRVIIDKQIDKNEQYSPEKLWTYSVEQNKLKHLR